MIAEGIERRDRHGVDGVGSDQFFDVEHVAIGLILGPGRCPQQPLGLGAFGGEFVPSRSGEEVQVALIGKFRIGDGDLALQRAQPGLFIGIVGAGDLVVEQTVHRGVDAADKETRHACDPRHVAALRRKRLETRNIGLDDPFVGGLREQQCDVHVDAAGDQPADGRQALRRRRHLDHQIPAIHRVPQPLGFRQGRRRIGGKIGRNLDADKAVGAVRRLVPGPKHVGRLLDILDRKMFENLAGRAVACLQKLRDGAVVFVAMSDRMFEN